MKTLFQILLVASIALLAGCKGKPKSNPPSRPPVTNEAAAYPEAGFEQTGRPAKDSAAKEKDAEAGTKGYLDTKNGFRDVTFGKPDSEFQNLVLKSTDDRRGLKTYARTGDEMMMDGIPLSTIEYTFLKGRLFQVVVKWTVEEKDAVLNNSPTKSLAPFCASLYGPAKHHLLKKEAAEYLWRGKQVELLLNETRLSGVPDTIHGGWALAPSTRGSMIIEDMELRKSLAAETASANGEKKDGL